MTISLILSVFSCLLFAAIGFVAWHSVLKNTSDLKQKFYAWTWFCAAGIVGFMGLRTLLYGLGYIIWDLVFALIDQLFLVGFLILCGFYAVNSVFSNTKLAKMIIAFVIFPLVLLFVVLVIFYMIGIITNVQSMNIDIVREQIIRYRVVSAWGSEFVPPKYITYVTALLALIETALLLANTIKNFLPTLTPDKIYKALASLALIIFIVALSFDQTGDYAGWKLLLFRSFSIGGAMLAYLAGSAKNNT